MTNESEPTARYIDPQPVDTWDAMQARVASTDRDAAVDAVMAAVEKLGDARRDYALFKVGYGAVVEAKAAVRAAVERVIASEREWADRLHKAVQHTLAAVNHTHGIGSCIGCVEAGEVMREYDERQRGVR